MPPRKTLPARHETARSNAGCAPGSIFVFRFTPRKRCCVFQTRPPDPAVLVRADPSGIVEFPQASHAAIYTAGIRSPRSAVSEARQVPFRRESASHCAGRVRRAPRCIPHSLFTCESLSEKISSAAGHIPSQHLGSSFVPLSFIVLGMGHHISKEYSSRPVIDLRNKAVCAALNVEHRKLPNRVSAWKHAPHFRQIFPLRLLRDPVPCVQRHAQPPRARSPLPVAACGG
jgi:hypothetical protein